MRAIHITQPPHRRLTISYTVESDIDIPAYPCRRLGVWRVVLSDDGTSFAVQHLNTFWTNGRGELQGLSLMGDFFGRILRGTMRGVSILEIIQWNKSTSDIHYKAAFRLQDPRPVSNLRTRLMHTYYSGQIFARLQLLPESRALVVSDEYLWIYTIPTLQSSTELTIMDAPAHSAIHVIPLARVGFRGGELSLPCIDFRGTQLALFTGSQFYRFMIPHEVHSPPSVSTLIKFTATNRDGACVGLRRSLMRFSDSSARIISYHSYTGAHEDGQETQGSLRHCFHLPVSRYSRVLPMMDEGTGRIVQQHISGTVLVSDLSIYYNYKSDT